MKVNLVSSGIVKIPPLKGGAVEEHVVNLSKNIRKYCDVKIIDRLFSNNDLLHINGVEIFRIQSYSINFHPRINHIINEYLFSRKLKAEYFEEADIIHAHNIYTALKCMKIAKKTKNKFVYTCHNGMWSADKVNLYEKVIVREAEKNIVENSAISIAVSKNLKENICKKAEVDKEKIEVIYNGVDIEFFNPDVNCDDIRKKFELSNKFVLLFVGRVAPAKGLVYLIKAINEIKHLPIVTLIVGPLRYMFGEREEFSDYARELIELVEKYNLQKKIIFTDTVPRKDLPKFYSCADIFILPSIYEAMPMVCVEAMAAGRPVIGSRIGGIQEIVRDGENGFLFESCNYRELSEKIFLLIKDENERIRMGINSRKITENEFSWDIIGKKIFNVYKKAL